MKPTILITGACGFIGFHLVNRLCSLNYQVVGVDNLNSYYDVKLKKNRLKILLRNQNFRFFKINIKNKKNLYKDLIDVKIDSIIHLAAQAGARHSIAYPQKYIDSNITGFLNILELCKDKGIKLIIYSSPSSVYGKNVKTPYSESDGTDFPVSMYAVSKKTNELMAHAYSEIYNINTIGLRYFTVYGPWGRPDMSYFKFTNKIINEEKIDLYNKGNHFRSFTYIDDIIEGIIRLFQKNYKEYNGNTVYNIGFSKTINIMNIIKIIEDKLDKKGKINLVSIQKGDVLKTESDSTQLESHIHFKPMTSIDEGMNKFIKWYLDYYKINI